MKTDQLFQSITDRIVAQMEAGVSPWAKPWTASKAGYEPTLPHNIAGRAYRGANVAWLWATAEAMGYDRPIWMTYNQAVEAGGSVRKGEKGTHVFFWNFKKIADEKTGEERQSCFAKAYCVFNIAQVDGVEAPAPIVRTQGEVIQIAEDTMARTGAAIRHGGDMACYVPSVDMVRLPFRDAFNSLDAYYGTAFHELGHWTGAKSRLDRQFGKRFGDDAYAFEELVAEMTAAFMAGALGLASEPREDHAAYLSHWIRILKGDPRAFITAAGKAQAAADFILKCGADEGEEGGFAIAA